ncbi:NAD(P)H-dependent oxidoreductase, partial [Thermodesulfobacteriota bacterium]
MTTEKQIIGIVGSPNREGRTHQLVTAALDGVSRTGADVELIQMADHEISACKDCLPWVCKDNGVISNIGQIPV